MRALMEARINWLIPKHRPKKQQNRKERNENRKREMS